MGARLAYLKVIDRESFLERGGRIHPGLHNEVVIRDEPGRAATFLVLRGWTQDHGTFTEQWRIESPGGEVVYESLPRELHLATREHTERLEDELADLEFQYAAEGYSLVLTLDEHEVARIDFPVIREDLDRAGRA